MSVCLGMKGGTMTKRDYDLQSPQYDQEESCTRPKKELYYEDTPLSEETSLPYPEPTLKKDKNSARELPATLKTFASTTFHAQSRKPYPAF